MSSLENFLSRWATFGNLYERIKLDAYYPEDKLDFIAEKFFYYREATLKDNQQQKSERLMSIKNQEHPISEEELEQILSQL
jgi:hypothetical protein